MNESPDHSFRSLILDGGIDGGKKKGTLQIYGGAFIEGNLFLKKGLNTQGLTGTSGFFDLTNEKYFDISNDLISTNGTNLGSKECPWSNVWCDDLNIFGILNCNFIDCQTVNATCGAFLGSGNKEYENGRYDPVLSIEEQTVQFKIEKFELRDLDNNEILIYDKNLSFSKDIMLYGNMTIEKELPKLNFNDGSIAYFDKKFILSNELVVLGGGVINTFNKIKIDTCAEIDLSAKISLFILAKNNLTIKIIGNYKQGVSKKIVNYKNTNTCTIDFGNTKLQLNDSLEMLYDGKNWIQI